MNAILPARAHPGRLIARLTLLLIAMNLVWRLAHYAANPPLWGDEAYLSVNFLVRDFAGLRQPLEYGQVAPIGYLWLVLGITRWVGASEWSLRLVPFVTGLASVPLFWLLARRLLGRRSTLLAVAIFTASYYPARYGSEAKPYMVDLFAALVITLAALPVLRNPQSLGAWGWLTLVSCGAIWISYPSAFIAGGAALAAMYRLNRSPDSLPLGAALLYGGAILVSFASLYLVGARTQAEGTAWIFDIPMWNTAFPPLNAPWRLPIWLVSVHTGEMFSHPLGGKYGGSTLWFVLAIIGAAGLWAKCRTALVLLCAPFAVTFAAAAMHRYPYGGSIRTTLYLTPAICLLVGLGLSVAFRRLMPRRAIPGAIRAVVAVCALIMLSGMVRDVVRPKQTAADWENRRVLRDLARQSRPGDRWISFNALGDVPYAPNLLHCRGPGARMRFYLTTLAPGPVAWAPPADETPLNAQGNTYLIVYRDGQVTFGEDLLPTYINQLTPRAGPPMVTRHSLDKEASIEVYRFGPSP